MTRDVQEAVKQIERMSQRALDGVVGVAATVACVLLVAAAWVDSHWRLHHPPRPPRADRRDLVRRLLDRQADR